MTTTGLNNSAPEVVFETQIRELFGRTAYSHKTQEKSADFVLAKSNQVKFIQIVLSAITAGSFLIDVFGKGRSGVVIGTICSMLLLLFTTYTKDFNLGELAQKHASTASQLWLVREKYFTLLTDFSAGQINLDAARKFRDELLESLDLIYKDAPRSHPKAYPAAQKALKSDEDLTFSDEEIDVFLPKSLKRSKK